MPLTPVHRLLIANRGEIARRIAATASSMGIEVVAVYARSDAGAPYVAEADDAVALTGTTAAETYLDAGQLLAAANRAGADAIHPGYGFLSEQASFAQAVLDAHLTWIGPPPHAIAAMGDKLAAKQLMAAAGVPVLPSVKVDGAPEIPGGREIPGGTEPPGGGVPPHLDLGGWPLVVKASAGGGGKGMRVVADASGLPAAIAAARREAQAAFGDPTVFIERYLTDARHVEIQVLADAHGGAVHCFERDCSIQRRHQKIIEEAPSPAVDDALRARLGDAALAAIRAVGYRNAGTVEFVVDPAGEFFFLEVNTRLQVEHPVTEAITGLDLAREQIRIAEGHPLSFGQADLTISGHAIEARLYAEDPAAGFLPATGRLVAWLPPAVPALRWESGVRAGSTVGLEFDPLLAKVIAHAPTRAEAAAALALGLQRAVIRGLTTNRDFLVAALRHPQFVAGEATTSFVETAGISTGTPPPPEALRMAAITAALWGQQQRREGATVLRSLPSGWRNSVMPPERVLFVHRDTKIEVTYAAGPAGTWTVTADGHQSQAVIHRVEGQPDEVEIDGRRQPSRVDHRLDRWWVSVGETDIELRELPRFPEPEREVVPGALAAPMPGKVLGVAVGAGDQVAEGDLLVIVEAMKMEHRVTAPHAGTVTEVRVLAGAQVTGGDLLVVLQ